MKQFILAGFALAALAGCGGGGPTAPGSASASTPAPTALTLTPADLTAIGLKVNGDPSQEQPFEPGQLERQKVPVGEAVSVVKKVGALVSDPNRGVTLLFDGPVVPGTYADHTETWTANFTVIGERKLWDYVTVDRGVSGAVLRDAAREVLRNFLSDPDHVDLVAPYVIKELIGGDAREFLKTGRAVLTQEFVPIPGDAGAWYEAYQNTEVSHEALEAPEFKVATATLKKIIPDLNPSAVDLYLFLQRRYSEGGAKLVAAYQKWGKRALETN